LLPRSSPFAAASGNLGRTAGGAILYHALPHLAFRVIGPTVRGYFAGRGAVDGFVGLTIGGMPLSQWPAPSGVGVAGLVAFDQVVGAEIALSRRLRFSPAVAVTGLIATAGGADTVSTSAMPPYGGLPELTLSLRLGWTFAIVR
jgi:hypothetical protein